nr:hypothetical protein [Lachnospiraceae bacterium]
KQTAEVVRAERDAGVTTFVDGMESFAAYREKYLRCVFLFRRIEFDLFPEEREADLAWFRAQRISAYSAAAILYNLISLLGHREKILLTLAADALESGDLQGACRLLAAIQEPSQEAVSLREELAGQMI